LEELICRLIGALLVNDSANCIVLLGREKIKQNDDDGIGDKEANSKGNK
jgi:hypothetical protein